MTHVKQLLIKEECIVYDLILERYGVRFYGSSSGDQIYLFPVNTCLMSVVLVIGIFDDLFCFISFHIRLDKSRVM